MQTPEHHATCDCAAHAKPAAGAGSPWASVLPVLACAVCPACLSAYAKVLSAFGVGLFLSERQHAVILSVAVACSLVVSGARSVKSRRWWPLSTSLAGSVLVVAGHVGEWPGLEWAGVVTLLVGGLAEMPLVRRVLRLGRGAPVSAPVRSP